MDTKQEIFEGIRGDLYGLYDKYADQGLTLEQFIIMITLALTDGFKAIATEQYGIEYKSQY